MKKKIKKEILYLAQSIFDDVDYNKILNYLNNDRLNDLRLFISDNMEMYDNIFMLNKEDQNLKRQLELLNHLENIILEEYLEMIE
jgi:hypothetical protein